MSMQQRTLDDLKTGVNVQIGKDGRIRFRMQPQMGLPSVELIDKRECQALLRVARAAKDVADDAYYSEDGGPHYLVDAPFIHDLAEALKEVEHLLGVVR